MNLRRPRIWQRLVALAPLVLVLVSLPSQVLVRCRMDGRLREACCCPRDAGAAPAAPAVTSADCCAPETSVRQLPVARASAATESAPVLAVTFLSALPDAAKRTPARRARPSAPAREGPPLRLLKQAFLI
jgi:hypothetical protein